MSDSRAVVPLSELREEFVHGNVLRGTLTESLIFDSWQKSFFNVFD